MTTGIAHHLPDHLLLAYAAGTLSHPYAVVVATHVSMCDACRARVAAHAHAGGHLLESTVKDAPMSAGAKDQLMGMLDLPAEVPSAPQRDGIYPAPVVEALKNAPPRWKRMGMGSRQCILHNGPEGSVRLLYIPAGQAVPDHGHNGLELTLVLQGAFHDETGRFGVGDVEVADDDLEHTPIAEDGAPCICLAATDANLRFRALVPRLLQPLFRI
ncbi:MAG: ChrR family anti-sigma-E factor [Thalassovita sp.]